MQNRLAHLLKAVLLIASSAVVAMGRTQSPALPFDEPPMWAREAVWYQIFVERFRNGDPGNDPEPQYMRGAYPGYVPSGWKVTPWNQDWYEQEDWADGSEFCRMVQARRFGGDLQGVLEKLDYLQQLGVTLSMILLHHFTFVSAPHIWNGDERGMWGADDPDCRKPVVWEDIDHRPQIYRPDGKRTKPIAVKTNLPLLDYYRTLIALRKQRPELVYGKLNYILADDEAMTLAYRRSTADRKTIVAFNRSDTPQIMRLSRNTHTMLKLLAESRPASFAEQRQTGGEMSFELAPLSGVALGAVP